MIEQMTAAESASRRRELVQVRYEIQKDELAVFFTKDEVNIALSYENAMQGARGVSSGELIYACVVDSINEKTGMPAIDWRTKDAKANYPERAYPESMEGGDGAFVVSTRDGQSVAVSSGV